MLTSRLTWQLRRYTNSQRHTSLHRSVQPQNSPPYSVRRESKTSNYRFRLTSEYRSIRMHPPPAASNNPAPAFDHPNRPLSTLAVQLRTDTHTTPHHRMRPGRHTE